MITFIGRKSIIVMAKFEDQIQNHFQNNLFKLGLNNLNYCQKEKLRCYKANKKELMCSTIKQKTL